MSSHTSEDRNVCPIHGQRIEGKECIYCWMDDQAALSEGQFDFGTRCCFCGADNRNDPIGYAGERCCSKCGKGGGGEPDEPRMAYKGNLA
jgi:hypothetical protein